jgi:hypothetical protein
MKMQATRAFFNGKGEIKPAMPVLARFLSLESEQSSPGGSKRKEYATIRV